MNQERAWADRSILVTGAASGIGRAVCTLLIESGARVAAIDQDGSRLDELRAELGSELRPCVFDVTQVEAWDACVERYEREWGPVDGLVYAAGRLVPALLCDAALNRHALQAVFDVHVMGLWGAARAVGRRMKQRGRGAIVAVTSNAGRTPRLNMGAYPASKAAADMLVQCLALELGPSGIRVNAVAPGSTDTPLLGDLLAGRGESSLVRGDLASFRTGIPLGRIAAPLDVAYAVQFLLSERARHITAHILRVDGGATWS